MNRFEMYMDSNALFLKVYRGDGIPKICIWGNDEYEKKCKCSVIFESLHTAVNTYVRIEHESGNDYTDLRVSWIPKENVRHIYGNVNTTIEDDIGKNINEFSKDLNSKIHNNIYSTVDLKFVKDLVKFIIDKFNELDVLNFSEDAKIILPFHDDIENY